MKLTHESHAVAHSFIKDSYVVSFQLNAYTVFLVTMARKKVLY